LQMLVHRQHLLYGNAFGATQLPASAGEFIPSNAYPLAYPAVTQLRPLISKVADVPTDGINCVTESYTPPWEKEMKQDDVAVDASQSSGQSVVPSDPTKPGVYPGPEVRTYMDHLSTAGEVDDTGRYGSIMQAKWVKQKR